MKATAQLLCIYLFAFTIFTSCSTDDTQMQEEEQMQEETDDTPEEEEEEEEVASFTIGDTGPAGGIVFYDKGEVTDGWQYIEVMPEDINNDIEWGCVFSEVEGAQGIEIGTGLTNSEAILAHHNALNNYYDNPEQCNENNNGTVAAKFVLEFEFGGFSDWHLPSRDEGVLFYTALHAEGLGNFDKNRLYWTSTEFDLDAAVAAAISVDIEVSGEQHWGWSGKNWDEGENMSIRPVRYF